MDEGHAVTTDEPLNRSAVGAAFTAVAARRPDAVALRWDVDTRAGSMTYGGLAVRARRLAKRLLDDDLAPGDRLALWSANNYQWIVAQLAAALAGVVLVPINPALTESEARFILTSSGARLLLPGPLWRGRDLVATASALATDVPDLRICPLTEWVESPDGDEDPGAAAGLPTVSPDDLMVIQYTSGTTGTPKGAMLTHLVGTNVGPLSHGALGLTEDDVICSPLPLHHVGGSVCTLLATLLRGATYVVLPGFEVRQTLTTLRRAEATFFGGVPTIMLALLEEVGDASPDLPALRMTMVGGSTVAPALITAIERTFAVEVANGYGQSEAPVCLQTRPGDTAIVKAQTIGRATPYREVTILDLDGVPVPPDVLGELCVRGELVMSGYWNERDASRSSAFDDAGWLHTGDLAAQDADGVVTLHGRLRDVIIRGGENIYPAEVESVLATHPDILDVAVIAAPDARWCEVPVAFVRTRRAALDPAELEMFARARLASFKVPRTWHQVPEFPLTASGKIQKYKLTELLAES
jgi:fatty-acyl-CoA synthase